MKFLSKFTNQRKSFVGKFPVSFQKKCAFFEDDVIDLSNLDESPPTPILDGGFPPNNGLVISCDQSFSQSGGQGEFEFFINFGSYVGFIGLNYNAFSIPDKFDFEWNGNTVTSKYVGASFYLNALLNIGIPSSLINLKNNGSGSLILFKSSPNPSLVKISVSGPLGGTLWEIQGICSVNSLPLSFYDVSGNGLYYNDVIYGQLNSTINNQPSFGNINNNQIIFYNGSNWILFSSGTFTIIQESEFIYSFNFDLPIPSSPLFSNNGVLNNDIRFLSIPSSPLSSNDGGLNTNAVSLFSPTSPIDSDFGFFESGVEYYYYYYYY
jgi:hypothetical protein